MQEEDWEAMCPVCQDVIDNPICPDCLEKEVEEWLATKSPRDMASIKTGIAYFRGEHGPRCIKCGKEVSICAYCFVKGVKEVIEEKSPEILAEFNNLFGFRKAEGVDFY